jgi:hypothetical protein
MICVKAARRPRRASGEAQKGAGLLQRVSESNAAAIVLNHPWPREASVSPIDCPISRDLAADAARPKTPCRRLEAISAVALWCITIAASRLPELSRLSRTPFTSIIDAARTNTTNATPAMVASVVLWRTQ